MTIQNVTEIVRGRAPLRVGLAGGGTDVSPYCDTFGGAVLNTTINLNAYATILPSPDGRVRFVATDMGTEETFEPAASYPTGEGLRLHRGVYSRIITDYCGGQPIPLTLVTSVDAPFGSGLGSSSALTVALVEAFRGLLDLPLGEYDVARLAYVIERVDIGLNGGRQDQYAATFGGINFIEFFKNDRVIVNPLQVLQTIKYELESSLLLYFTGASRHSADIIDRQSAAVRSGNTDSLTAMHQIKQDAIDLKAALLQGQIHKIAEIYKRSWLAKKSAVAGITNDRIDAIYDTMMNAGALAGKVSGAGGGGFMMFMVDPIDRERAVATLGKMDGHVVRITFTDKGSTNWKMRWSLDDGDT